MQFASDHPSHGKKATERLRRDVALRGKTLKETLAAAGRSSAYLRNVDLKGLDAYFGLLEAAELDVVRHIARLEGRGPVGKLIHRAAAQAAALESAGKTPGVLTRVTGARIGRADDVAGLDFESLEGRLEKEPAETASALASALAGGKLTGARPIAHGLGLWSEAERRLESFETALAGLGLAVEIADVGEHDDLLASLLLRAGDLYRDLGEDVRARALIGHAAGLFLEVGDLASHTQAVAALADDAAAPAPSEASSPASDLSPAEAVWEEIRDLEFESQRAHVETLGPLRIDLAELLFERSRIEGRDDRKRGVRIAELALACVEYEDKDSSFQGPDDLEIRRALAWTWLANAQRLALDFVASEGALSIAKELLPEHASDHVRADVLEIEGSLLHFRRRLNAAKETFERARSLLEKSPSAARRARILLQLAGIHYHLGEIDSSIEKNEQALLLLLEEPDTFLHSVAYQQLVISLIQDGSFGDAAVLLPAARDISRLVGTQSSMIYLEWYEGLILHGIGRSREAKRKLESAIKRFEELSETFYAAIALIDLGIVQLAINQPEGARLSCLRAVPLLQSLRAHREINAALRLLKEAEAGERLSSAVLGALRAKLETIRSDPSIR